MDGLSNRHTNQWTDRRTNLKEDFPTWWGTQLPRGECRTWGSQISTLHQLIGLFTGLSDSKSNPMKKLLGPIFRSPLEMHSHSLITKKNQKRFRFFELLLRWRGSPIWACGQWKSLVKSFTAFYNCGLQFDT